MANISNWSTTASSNSSTPPDGAPEGWLPSQVNEVVRENMAAVRRWYEDAEWQELSSPTYVSATSFTVTGDQTGKYDAGRALRITDASTYLYGHVVSSSFSSVTTVNVTLDSGTLSASLTKVEVGVIRGDVRSLPDLTGVTGFQSTGITDNATSTAITINASEEVSLSSGVGVTAILDEDDMNSDSATALATQQSIKAFVDNELAGISSSSISTGNTSVTTTDTGSDGTVTITTDGTTALTIDNTQMASFKGDIQVTLGDILPVSDSTIQDLGASNNAWTNGYIDQLHGVANAAKYADLAEKFQGTEALEQGTIVRVPIGADGEIEKATSDAPTRFLGVISENPAFLMNSGLEGESVEPVGYVGRIPTLIEGQIKKGQAIVISNTPGVGRALQESEVEIPYYVVGRALRDKSTDGVGHVEAVIGVH